MRLTRAWRRRLLPRFALVGLVFGFVMLAVGGLLAAGTTRRAIQTVDEAERIAAGWYSTFVFVSQESEAMNEYLRLPDDAGLRALTSQIASAQPTLDWLQHNVGTGTVRRVMLVEQGYQDFTLMLRDLADAAGRGDRAATTDIGAQASLSAQALRKMITSNLTFQRSQLRVDLNAVGQDNQRLHDIGVYVIAVDAVLLVLCAGLLLGYQRRVERHAASSRHQARHDPLTGLANRRVLSDELSRVVRDAADTGEPAGLLLIDLDGFKGVNDTLGHQAGDVLLQAVADRLTAAVRRTDLVARLGGDEFAVLLPAMPSVEQVGAIAATILDEIRRPVEVDGTTASVSASIGVALCPGDADDHEQLFRHADAAMYAAKRSRLGVVFHADTRPSVLPAEPQRPFEDLGLGAS